MFDFIKRMFSGKKEQGSQPRDVAALDVVEGNDIEILRTSEYREGTSADAIEQLVAEKELPPAELDLNVKNDLDESTDAPSMSLDIDHPDNYLFGDMKAAQKRRDKQARKAAIQYWNEGTQKYRPRHDRHPVEGTNAKQLNYFEVLRDEPMLRQVELQNPGISIEHLNLSKFMHNSLKGRMVSEYVLKSMKLIRGQQDNGLPLLSTAPTSTAGGSELRDAHSKTLRDMFNAYNAERVPLADSEEGAGDNESEEVEKSLQNFQSLFQHESEDENQESYTRWLLSVAEEGTASQETMWLLVDDPNPDVRFCLAENYNIGQEILKVLSEDENPYVAHRAQKTITRMNRTEGKVFDRDFGCGGEINRYRKSS